MTPTMGLTLSTDFAAFLDERIDANGPDACIADAFAAAEIPAVLEDVDGIGDPFRVVPDQTAHDFYSLTLVGDAPRITYTTRDKFARACIAGFSGHPFTDGVGWRIAAKPATVAQRVTQLPASDYGRAYDVFSQACAAWLMPESETEIVIVTGEDITHHYAERNHCSCSRNLGDLGDSCMRYSKCQDRFGLYEDNARLAVLPCPNCDGTRARALLWEDIDGQEWIDRIYAGPADTETVKAWARQHSYRSVWHEGHHGAISHRQVIVSAPDADYESAPYLDSLIYWCRTCGELSNEPCDDSRHWRCMLRDYMYGDHHDGWTPPCSYCGSRIDTYSGQCGNATQCDACLTTYCQEDDRPCACAPCPGCEQMLRPRQVCPDCYVCPCGQIRQRRDVGRNLGRCICGEVLEPAWTDYREAMLRFHDYSTHHELCLIGDCPHAGCGGGHSVYRYPDGTIDVPGTENNPVTGEGFCYRCGGPVRWVLPDMRPVPIVPPAPLASPARLRVCAEAMRAAAYYALPQDVWTESRSSRAIALYATYDDQRAASVLDGRGSAVAGCGCNTCERYRQNYDARRANYERSR